MLQIVLVVVLMFGLGAILGAPWLPTRRREIETTLDLLKLKPGQKVLDLGSGAGGFMLAAAKRKIYVKGYEINPVLWLISYLRLWPYRSYAQVKLSNFWLHKLPECDAVFVFLIDRYMTKLDHKLSLELKEGTRLASFIFKIPGKKTILEQDGIYLYQY